MRKYKCLIRIIFQKFGHDVSLLSEITEEPPTDLINASNVVTRDPWGGECHRNNNQELPGIKTATIGHSRKVPPPTLPKPKFHPSFLTDQN